MQRLRVVLFRFLIPVRLQVYIASRIVITGRKGVALDRRIAVPQSTLVVLQLYLRYRAVEIGFCQIRLKTNDLVEVLDGQDLVLEIQGIPSDRRDAVGVELRPNRSTEYRVQNTE